MKSFVWQRFCFILIKIIILQACVNKTTENASTQSYSPVEVVNMSDSVLSEYFSQKFPDNEPGGAVLVRAGNRILISQGYGVSDIDSNERVTSRTLFNLGSISKTFVSNAILILQAEGRLSVEDDLLKYFPEFQNKEIARKVKIKHLLTHTSGLPDIRFPLRDSIFYLSAKDWENWSPIMKATKLNFQPGSNFEYSNPSFNALALIIEKVNGGKWQTFVSEKIFDPTGMNTSTITDGPHPEAGVAHAYIKINGNWIEKDYGEEPTFAAAGNGGVWSSVEELSLYYDALLNNRLLGKELQAEATSIRRFSNWKGKQDPFIGWAWFIAKTKDGHKTVGHTGSQGGFRANFLSVPDKQWLIILLSSTPRNLEEYTNYVLNYLQSSQ